MDDIAQVDWLAHRWPFEIRRNWSNGVTRYEVVVGPLNICAHGDEAIAQTWIDGVKLESLGGIVACYRELHPVQVLIEGRGGRMARIPPELWATYDGLVISATERCVGVLSAKARSLFDHDPCVFVRIYKIGHDQKRGRRET